MSSPSNFETGSQTSKSTLSSEDQDYAQAAKGSSEKKNSIINIPHPTSIVLDDIFALLPDTTPDVLEKDRMKLALLAAKRKESEEKEEKYISEASKRLKQEEKAAKKKAREDRARQEKEAASAAERDRRMLILFRARREAEAKGEEFDEETFLAEMQREAREKQEEIEKKQNKPNKLHVKEVQAAVEGLIKNPASISPNNSSSSNSSRTNDNHSLPRSQNKKKGSWSPSQSEEPYESVLPKPKKVLRDLTVIGAEQRAETRRALVKQTFEAARRKSKSVDGHLSETDDPSTKDRQTTDETTTKNVLEVLPEESTSTSIDQEVPVVDRCDVAKALQLAKCHTSAESDGEEAALHVAMSMLDKLSAETAEEIGQIMGAPMGNTSRAESEKVPPEMFQEPLPKVPAMPVIKSSPTRISSKKDPLRLALEAARRLALAEKRSFNQEEFTRIWQEMEQAPTDDIHVDDSNTAVLPEQTKERERDNAALDKMRLALVAAKTAAFEKNLPWNESSFKREYWAREDAEAEQLALSKSLSQESKLSAAEREAKMLALAQSRAQREVEHEILLSNPPSPPLRMPILPTPPPPVAADDEIDDANLHPTLKKRVEEGTGGVKTMVDQFQKLSSYKPAAGPHVMSCERSEDGGVKTMVDQYQKLSTMKYRTASEGNSPGRLVNMKLSAQVLAGLQEAGIEEGLEETDEV